MIGAIVAKSKALSAFEALNRRDVRAHLRDYSQDATYVFPGSVSSSGTFRGKKAIEEWFAGFLDQFPTLKFTLKNVFVANIFALGGTNAVAVEWEFAYSNRKGTQDTNTGMTVINLKGGKVDHVEVFVLDAEAQKKAWAQ